MGEVGGVGRPGRCGRPGGRGRRGGTVVVVLESEIIEEISPIVFGRHQRSSRRLVVVLMLLLLVVVVGVRHLNIVVRLLRSLSGEFPEGVRREDVVVVAGC